MTLPLCSMFPIGLLEERGYICGMMTIMMMMVIIGMMMIMKIIFKCYDGYQKRKAQKASIKEELMDIAWHPSRYWDWCMSEDEKQETEKLLCKYRPFMCLMTGYKFFFDLERSTSKLVFCRVIYL